jgi:hypothetical protein
MPWEENRNNNSLSPCGLKEASGFAQHVDGSAGTEQPPGILSMTPLGAGKSSPYMPDGSSRPPRGAPQAMTPPHNPAPHRKP